MNWEVTHDESHFCLFAGSLFTYILCVYLQREGGNQKESRAAQHHVHVRVYLCVFRVHRLK